MRFTSPALDPLDLIGPSPDDRHPEIRMISAITISGAIAVRGNSGALGNETDSKLLLTLRHWADVILVGAGTVRAENYGGVKIPEAERRARVQRGQAPTPPIAVVSGTLNLDPGTRLFTETETAPILLTSPHADVDKRKTLEEAGASVLSVAGDAESIVSTLHELGFRRIVCEGGAQMFGQLAAADLIDVMHLTIDPMVTTVNERPLFDTVLARDLPFSLEDTSGTADGVLFLRYRRTR